jgi:hypothetical protein
MSAHVLEIVRFKLNPKVGENEFLASVPKTDRFLQTRKGFVSRRLSKAPDGVWTDIVEWTDAMSAKVAAEAIMMEVAVGPFMQAIDPATVEMSHQDIKFAA